VNATVSRPDAATPAAGGNSLIADLIAGTSVALVLIPQSMAYAELAGMPAWHGLYAAAAAPILAAPFVSSRHLQTGPVALTCLLTAGALAGTAAAGSAEYVGLAAVLALIVAVARLIIGLMRWGGVAWLMSQPVLRGFTLAAALLILSSQVPSAMGASSGDATVLKNAWAVLSDPGTWTWGAVLISVLTIVLMRAGNRIHRLFPGVLVAAAIGIAASVLGLPIGATIGEVPAGLPPLSLDLPWSSIPSLAVSGIVIALVGFAEAASIARTFAAEDRESWDPNREFISQGAANLAAGLFSGFPVGGSFSRSSLARLAGGRTRLTGLITGLVVLAILPVAGVLAPLPRAVLGATVIGAIIPLLDPRPVLQIWQKSPLQAFVGAATFATTLAMAPHVEYGVLVGVVLAMVVHLWREAGMQVPVEYSDGELRLRPAGALWFVTAAHLEQQAIDALANHPEATAVLIDLGGLGRVDYSGALVIDRIMTDLDAAGLSTKLCGVPTQAAKIISRVCGEKAAGMELREQPGTKNEEASERS